MDERMEGRGGGGGRTDTFLKKEIKQSRRRRRRRRRRKSWHCCTHSPAVVGFELFPTGGVSKRMRRWSSQGGRKRDTQLPRRRKECNSNSNSNPPFSPPPPPIQLPLLPHNVHNKRSVPRPLISPFSWHDDDADDDTTTTTTNSSSSSSGN